MSGRLDWERAALRARQRAAEQAARDEKARRRREARRKPKTSDRRLLPEERELRRRLGLDDEGERS